MVKAVIHTTLWMKPEHITLRSQTLKGQGGTGRPGMLQSMGSQRVGNDLVTEQIAFLLSYFLSSRSMQRNSFYKLLIGPNTQRLIPCLIDQTLE